MPEVFDDEPRLFMTELLLLDWREGVRWYVETLGLKLIMQDEARRFALLGDAKNGQLALKETREFDFESPSRFRLVFQVDDLEVTRERLRSLGIQVGDISRNEREAYREVRLLDPEGTRITLFNWIRQAHRERSADNEGKR